MKRHAKPPYLSSTPRSLLNQSQHGSIDTLLKELKICSQRLRVVLTAFKQESQILERLYYKGKNQHHGALFWRRVAETRRYCGRINGVQIDKFINALRCSFFGEGARNNPKLTKGPWTHLPDILSINLILERLSSLSALTIKTHTILENAYRSFTLAMQSGAFLQLILTLTAIASRLAVISSELQETLDVTSNAVQRISLLLDPILSTLPENTTGSDLSQDASKYVFTSEPVFIQEMDSLFTTEPSSRVVIEHKIIQNNMGRDRNIGDTRTKPKKRNPRKDEIDDIFGL